MLSRGFPTAGCNGLGWIRHIIRLVSKRQGSSLRRLEEEQAGWQYYNQSKAAGHRQTVPIREVHYGYRWHVTAYRWHRDTAHSCKDLVMGCSKICKKHRELWDMQAASNPNTRKTWHIVTFTSSWGSFARACKGSSRCSFWFGLIVSSFLVHFCWTLTACQALF